MAKIVEFVKNNFSSFFAVTLGLSAVSVICFFPPAVMLFAPIVNFLADALSAAGLYAGLIAYGTILTSVGLLTTGVALGLLNLVSYLFSAKTAKTSVPALGTQVSPDGGAAVISSDLERPIHYPPPLMPAAFVQPATFPSLAESYGC